MAENCTSESLHTQDQVEGASGSSYDEKTALEHESRTLRSDVINQQTAGLELRSKRHFKGGEISSTTDDNSLFPSDDSSAKQECQNIPLEKTKAVCFSIEIDNTCTRKPPERLLAMSRHHKNTTTTLESLNEKQIQAEKRRKQQIKEKLQRIHERQEAARKLAENVDILLQQRALSTGDLDNNIKQLPSRQIMVTANEVAKHFRDLTKQLNNDLTLKVRLDLSPKEKLDMKKLTFPKMKLKPEKTRDPSQVRKNTTTSNVSFTVELDMSSEVQKKSKRPVLSAKQKKVLTREDLEEKLIEAEERRNKRKERRVKRVQENREALMKMAKDIERFESLQTIESTKASPRQVKETALLADRIADGFDRLSKRYNEDLKRAENFFIEQPFVVGP